MSNTNVLENVVHPAVGEIHSRRISIGKLFGTKCDFPSSASSLTSSRSSKNRVKKRPCLIWRTLPNVQVLVMSRFDGVDVTDRNISFMDHLPREYVLNRLLAVHDRKPIGGRRSITAATPTPPLETTDTYMILIAILDEEEEPWKRSREYFPKEELEYIHKILLEIHAQENEEQLKIILKINPPSAYHDDNDDNKNDTNSSSTSSLPRARMNLTEKVDLTKNDCVKKWLNDIPLNGGDADDDDAMLSENLRPTTSSNNSEHDILLNDESMLLFIHGIE